MLSKDQAERLRDDFQDAGYTAEAVLARLGDQGQAGVQRNCSVPALRRLAGCEDAQAQLIRLFPLQQAVPRASLESVLDIGALLDAQILDIVPGGAAGVDSVRALVDVRTHDFEDPDGHWSGWVASDPPPGMDRRTVRTRPDYVLGVSPASISLADLSIPDHVGRALDLGTGSGVQALHLARHADRVVATDLNPRAVELARLTMDLNGLDVTVRSGSLYEPVHRERFDLVVSNPPYVMSPPAPEGRRLVYREGDFRGDGLVRAVVRGAREHLAEGGVLQVLANWADIDGQDWKEGLAGWAGCTGCQTWVVEREHLDIYRYIEMWLTDAGLDGDPNWQQRYREWLDYFAQLSVTGVGMGWIMVRNSGCAQPDVHIEQWPYEIAQPVGPAVSRQLRARRFAQLPGDEILAASYRISSDVVQESIARPGASDPSHIVMRQGSGLKRAMQVDTALGGVLGACDGQLSLAVILDVVANLLDEDAVALRERLLPGLRQALTEGFLLQTGTTPSASTGG